MEKQVDILIVGAGISGIGLAAHLSKHCPQRSFEIIERRESIGGTWDLFKYPGIRSDSDMSTFGFNFKPWQKTSVLADGPSIKGYLNEVVTEFQLEPKIHYQHRVISANYDSASHKWSVKIEDAEGKTQTWIANFVLGCTGYYNYDQGFQPDFPNQQAFKGQFIHPQHWPENLDYRGKKVVIIGSGATAITLVPAMVKGGAGHVTMLQRSPTYIASVPSIDVVYAKMRKYLPEEMAYKLTRARNIGMQRGIYALAQKQPKLLKKLLLNSVKFQLKGKVDMKHFTPNYEPWDQRLCVVPDGDLFKILREGHASVETDHIEKLTETGILLKSGKHLEADIIVSATGLNIQILGGIQATLDGKPLNTSQHMLYRGIMVSDVPNMALIIGYINASWTLKVDIAAEYICRLLNHMDHKGYDEVVAQGDVSELMDDTVMGSLSSGYIARAADVMPKQGKHAPWHVSNNYLADRKDLKQASFKDGVLKFKTKVTAVQSKPRLVS
ncbi:NAD(P)/FAD-dependent oxidoreductase [Acinetobacter sp. RF15A]|uniref:flavin-containing monooxygenase n=1 Tax=unclassified Acinetobacter TaxID=196816 RepID=UPI00119417B2|nr:MULTISPECIES: NAD(P)/FAD-dependent oxidoreductase [unclassified Acinetobacter]MDM1781082.1 NAD(P)/FAD-dependent oxidoreductase [Acinetobacter indicus]TSH77273.1 NAD(P)/FAD-dependent oxidoreductase [Acinetobacter sp. RF15A]TSI19392.1 NAD(P)/FAD-dependent oxidoreductase [Acinetobacter sp. RF15B]